MYNEAMARRKRGFKIFLRLVLLGALAWAGFRYYGDIAVYLRSRPKVRELVSEQSAPRLAPAGFGLKNLKEKEFQVNIYPAVNVNWLRLRLKNTSSALKMDLKRED